MLELWDEQMVSYGQKIIRDRGEFCKSIRRYSKKESMQNFPGNKEELSIRYEKKCRAGAVFRDSEKNRERDKKFKMTFSRVHIGMI